MSTTAAQIRIQENSSAGQLEARVGATPLLELQRITAGLPSRVRIFAKAEWFNPSGSTKDRPALSIMRSGIAAGELRAGRRLLDSSSGNMGIAYATFGAARGIPITLCVPENASSERMKILAALGAEVILTDASEGSDGAMWTARAMADRDPARYWYANQYDNEANWRAHFESTGPEIEAALQTQPSHLVVGVGTSGTLLGVGRHLRQQNPGIQVIGVEPATPLHGLEGLKHMPSAEQPGIYDPNFANRIVRVETEAAHEMVRELAQREGLFVGVSSGAAMVAALAVANELKAGTVVTVFPDAGFKYLSDDLIWSGNDTTNHG